MLTPTEIKRSPSGLHITWGDNSVSAISSRTLRENCPCAVCLERRGSTAHSTPIGEAKPRGMLKIVSSSSDEETRLEKIWAIGNYALGMQWGDGHRAGVYTFEFLRRLGAAGGVV